MTLAHESLIASIFAATAAIMVSSGLAQTIPPSQRSVSGVSIAASPPVSPQIDAAVPSAGAPSGRIDNTEPQAYAHSDTLADCISYWDPGTHMSKAEWRRACKRTQNGTWAGDYH